jgi:hypothetical protein
MSNEESDVVTSADSGPESTRLLAVRAQLLAHELELRQVKDAHSQLLEQAHRFNEVAIENEAMRAKVLAEDVANIEHRAQNRCTLRDYFAVSALNGMLANGLEDSDEDATLVDFHEDISFKAYALADAMLAARKGAE